MFLNYIAGVLSLVLAVSAFVPWITVWFYSLKGIESGYGIVILVMGLLGATVSAFQHLSGKIRGVTFIAAGVVSLACEVLYFRKLREFGAVLKDVLDILTGLFGEKIMTRVREILGDQMTKAASMLAEKFIQRAGLETALNSFDFIGGGLILAVLCSLMLLAVGLILEKNKTTVDS